MTSFQYFSVLDFSSGKEMYPQQQASSSLSLIQDGLVGKRLENTWNWDFRWALLEIRLLFYPISGSMEKNHVQEKGHLLPQVHYFIPFYHILPYFISSYFCQTPVLRLGVDFTFNLDNNDNNDNDNNDKNNPHLNFLKGTVLGVKG